MRDSVSKACQTLLGEPYFNDFWLLSMVRDNSFEEGNAGPHRRLIDRYKLAGVPVPLLDLLRRGINGNLATVLGRERSTLGPVLHNQGEGHDFYVGPDPFDPAGHGCVESKLAYECTYQSYYKRIGGDYRTKLANTRRIDPGGDLFLVVFFVEVPSLDYPAGRC